MVIKLGDYVIEGSKLVGRYSKFDLFKLHTREKGKKKGEQVKKVLYYDATLEKVFQTIMQEEMTSDNITTSSVEAWLEKYERINKETQAKMEEVKGAFFKLVESNEKKKSKV